MIRVYVGEKDRIEVIYKFREPCKKYIVKNYRLR